MITTFISCFLNHHQLPLCEELKKNCDEFYFIASSPVPQVRQSMGYENLNTKYDFVLRTYDGSTGNDKVYELLEKSDIVIFGTSPTSYIEYRMKFNKPTFLFSERYFKKGTWRRFIPPIRKKIQNRIIRYKEKNLYVLCASAFMSSDLKLMKFDTEKCFRWGYFPQVKSYDACPERNNPSVRILWVGRMLPLKHAEDAVKVIAKLNEKGCDFTFDFIGSGECEQSLRKMIDKFNLNDRVLFLGTMKPSEVIENMENADVFLMTSDFHEGWGAVVNEAMSTGCAVLASSAIGSSPFLIKDGENGLIYEYGNNRDFEKKLRCLIEDASLRGKLGEGAYNTIKNDYNAAVAAKRLTDFVRNGCNTDMHHTSGPMTKAPVIKNSWYKA